jgi:two-component system, LuxR family, response regulator DctR
MVGSATQGAKNEGDRQVQSTAASTSPAASQLREAAIFAAASDLKARICLIDDDETTRDSILALFGSRRLRVNAYSDPVRFLSIWKSSELREVPATFVLDVSLPRMSAMELFQQMRSYGLPDHNVVLFLTGNGNVPLAVKAIKNGAMDFLEKPFSDNALVDSVIKGMHYAESVFSHSARQLKVREHLSEREYQIAELIVSGATSREIAKKLGICVRTVEVHRSNVYDKVAVRNAIELVTLFVAPNPPKPTDD